MKNIYTILFLICISNLSFAQIPVMNPISGPSVVCSSPTTPMTFSASAINSPTSYAWSVVNPGGVIIGNPSASITTISFPYSFGTYTIYCSASNGFGTSATTSFVVNVFETPTVTFSGVNFFCSGSSTNLQASSTILQASPTITYSWIPGYGLNVYNQPNVNASPTVTTIYTVTATKGMCSNSSQITVSVLISPTLNAIANPSVICTGNSSTLTASGASTINWTGGVLNGVGFFPPFTNNYTVTGIDPNGCTASLVRTIIVNPPPLVSAGASNTTVCSGSTVTVFGIGAVNYTWSNGITYGVPFTPTATTVYSVSGSSPGCTLTSNGAIMINVNPSPTINATSNFNTLCFGSSAIISINGTALSYSMDGISTPTNVIVSPTVTSNYVISGNDGNGCIGTQTLTLTVVFCANVKELNNNINIIKAYPNPNNGNFILCSDKNQTITISNDLGQIIKTIELKSNSEYYVNGLTSGIYFINSQEYKARVIILE